MNPLVSIVVPVYNAQETITRCVDSILNQTYKEIELLLVDDGSTDGSGQICDEYAKKDTRVHVLHKENTGVSDTRNRGIAAATGKYLQFSDSDDWISPEATELFVHTAETYVCDMVIADFYRVIGGRVAQKGAIEQEGLLSRAEYAAFMMEKPADFYYGVLWNKFYRRSVIEQYALQMDSEITWCEDFIFNLEYIRHIERIYALHIPVYYYVKTKGSIVAQNFGVKKTIQMKRTVFSYYNRFYMEVFGEEEYEARRLHVYRFLFDAAGDGDVPPVIMPGNFKLGAERTGISTAAKEGEGLFFDDYRENKLQERMLEVVALKNEMTTAEVKLLYYFSMPHGGCSLKEIGEILNISRGKLNSAIQNLLSKELIEEIRKEKEEELPEDTGLLKAEEAADVTPEICIAVDELSELSDKTRSKEKKRARSRQKDEKNGKKKARVWEYAVTPEADFVLSEIWFVLGDLEKLQYTGFTPEEIELYERLNARRNQNILQAL